MALIMDQKELATPLYPIFVITSHRFVCFCIGNVYYVISSSENLVKTDHKYKVLEFQNDGLTHFETVFVSQDANLCK